MVLRQWFCKCVVTLFKYFLVTIFFWMLVEGLYLHTMIVCPFAAARVRLWHYAIIGWGRMFSGVSFIVSSYCVFTKFYCFALNCAIGLLDHYCYCVRLHCIVGHVDFSQSWLRVRLPQVSLSIIPRGVHLKQRSCLLNNSYPDSSDRSSSQPTTRPASDLSFFADRTRTSFGLLFWTTSLTRCSAR